MLAVRRPVANESPNSMARSRLPRSPSANVAPADHAAEIERSSSLTAVRDFDRRHSPYYTSPPVNAAHSTLNGPRPVKPITVRAAPSSLLLAVQANGSIAPASQSRNGPLTSQPAASEPDSASCSREDSTVSSEDEDIPPPRRLPRGIPPAFPFGPRRDGRQFSGTWVSPSGFSSRHSQTNLRRHPGHLSGTGPRSESGDSDNGRTGLSAEAEIQEIWNRVDDQRHKVRHLRGDIARKRTEIRHLGHDKDEADNAFMQVIRPHLTSGQRMAVVPADVMGKRFGDMQRIRDDYYSAQTVLETLESEIDREEDELQTLEGDLFRLLNNQLGTSHRDSLSARLEVNEWRNRGVAGEDEDDNDDDVASRVTLMGISGDREEDVHPIYEELLQAIGDRDDAREHFDEIRSHRQEILHGLEMKLHRERVRNNQGNLLSEEELKRLKSSLTLVPSDAKTFKTRFGVSIGTADLQFLQAYDRQEAKVKRELAEASKKVDRLRNLCMEKGVMRKHAPYNEEYSIFSGTNRGTLHLDGNMTIDEYASTSRDLSHPKFPLLLSNPSHVLDLTTPLQALEKITRLPKDSPTTAIRRQDCIKEFGISKLMTNATSKPDFINQWLIHRLRTCPMEAELMLSVAEDQFRVRNFQAWQEKVLFFWKRDEAANISPHDFHGPMTPRGELEVDDESERAFNSVAAASTRARSVDVNFHRRFDFRPRSSQSLS